MEGVYKNSTEVASLGGDMINLVDASLEKKFNRVPIYMTDVVDACLRGRLNLFLQGDTGSGKTQLARDAMGYFPGKNLFVLGRNDMDTRELFQQVNPEFLRALRGGRIGKGVTLKTLTDKINNNLTVVDELPNCVPAVRAQLFNLFDGYIEIDGVPYQIGDGYSVGIATGNIGQKFTESSNELGRALKDRMHVIVDVDYFHPRPSDTTEILSGNTNPRVDFSGNSEDRAKDIIALHKDLADRPIPLEKIVIANYLIHGLDYCSKGSKRAMKEAWPTQLENHEQGSDVGLVLPVSVRAAKSIIRLSQALDDIAKEKGITTNPLESMMTAYKLVSTYSGVLNDADVRNKYDGNHYSALDAVVSTTTQQFKENAERIAAGIEMVGHGKKEKKILDGFKGRWSFMKNTLEGLLGKSKEQ